MPSVLSRWSNVRNAQSPDVPTNLGGANEVYVVAPNGAEFRVDSYIPGVEIVERKFTQLAEIDFDTASNYLFEMSGKYSVSKTILPKPSNIEQLPANVIGQNLTGIQVLEIPPQRSAVPPILLQYATSLNIKIRDSNGTILNP